jgi:hypothetical protein
MLDYLFKFPHHQDFRKKNITAFGSTYIREQEFSVVNYRNNKYCSWLANEHLRAVLQIPSSSSKAGVNKLAYDIHTQKSL